MKKIGLLILSIAFAISCQKKDPSNKTTAQNEIRFRAIEKGTFFTRDLVSEPTNVLNPKEYANRLLKLKRFGIKYLHEVFC